MIQHSIKLVFQEDRFSRNWTLLDPRVRAMVYEAAYRAERNWYGTYVTSVIRSDGVHGQRAAVDIDFIQKEPAWEHPVPDYHTHGEELANYLNATFKYGRNWLGKQLHCAVWHGGEDRETHAGWHLHIQAPPGRNMIAKDVS